MEIEIVIETNDNQLVADLLENTSSPIRVGYQKAIADGATATLQKINRCRSVNMLPEVVTIIISLSTSVAADSISSWLSRKLKGRATVLKIERKETEIENGEIKKIIEETISMYK